LDGCLNDEVFWGENISTIKKKPTRGFSSNRVFDAIREDILIARYKPGERIPESRLSKMYNVSRSPIREAFQRLASEGLLELIPQKCAVVKTYPIDQIRDLFELMEAVDGIAARAAALRIDSIQMQNLVDTLAVTESMLVKHNEAFYPLDLDFHQKILEAAKNDKILTVGWKIHSQLRISRHMSAHSSERSWEAYKEHLSILNAIKDRDPDNAERIMRLHVKNALQNLIDILWKEKILA